MADASILASLDKFIEKFVHDPKMKSGHRVATHNQPVATMNQLMNMDIGHFGHSGHPKQETFAGADQDGCNPRPSPAENSDADLARKVLNFDGHSGQSGQSFSNQELIYSHWENADGHNGKSLSNQQPAGLKGTGERAGPGFATTADASVSDPTIWSDLYKERAAIRQFDGGYPRDEAELLAWREVETRWHMAHGERVPRDLCAGCGHPIGEAEALDVIDGNRVHDCADNGCLIRHVERWRRAATRALVALGLRPPRADERRA